MNRKWVWFPVVLLAWILVWGGWETIVYKHRLNHLPEGLHVRQILYAKEKSWGSGGPGDNETGVIVYQLPETTAKRVAVGGADYLSSLGHFSPWAATPLRGERWLETDGVGDPWPPGHRPGLGAFLDQYGYGIPIRPDVVTLTDRALAAPGSYFAGAQGGGLIIIIPRARRVVFAYAG